VGIERFRAAFKCFELDTVEKGVIGVKSVLRDDVMQRYADVAAAVIRPDGVKENTALPSGSTVLFTSLPPIKGLNVRRSHDC
jgi:hypothetical protein